MVIGPPASLPVGTPVSPPASDNDELAEGNPESSWFLESIYIENFKSWKGRTQVGPMKPFCAIIGPNGSGKSNLMDAISFVMGEKTTSLRVKRLNELIHGASIGKPVSMNASVTAVFKQLDITDGETEREMRFARVIRGTAAEYSVNEQVVSWRQYVDDLKRLGINARGKNFLVFQGAIEKVAMKNEKERTALLEEICGSGALKEDYEKMKADLADAERKIEISHMKKKTVTVQRKEIRGELQEANHYNELLKQQTEKEIELYLFRLFHSYEDIEGMEGSLVGLQTKKGRFESMKAQAEEELKAKKKERGEITRALGLKEAALNTVEKEKGEWLPKKIAVEQKRKHLQKRLTTAEKSLKQAEENKANQDQDLIHLSRNLKEVKGKEKAFMEEHIELQMSQGVDITLRESQINEYWELKKEVNKATEKEKQKGEVLRKNKKDAADVFNSVSREKADLESKLEIAVHEINEKKKLAKKSFEAKEELKAQQKSKEEEIGPFRKEILEAEASIEKLQQDLEKISASIEAVKIDRHDATRKRKKQEVIDALKAHFKGVKDRMTNLCKPRHPSYNIAITKIMSKNMEAIVVDSEKTARDCIQYLREQMMEPEVFLPLDLLEVQPLRQRIREQAQAQTEKMYLAYDLLEFSREIEKAVLHCVKSTVVCPSSKLAEDIARGNLLDEATNAVSLEGTYYATSGIISGGKADLQRKSGRWSDSLLAQNEQKKSRITEELKHALKTARKRADLDFFEQELSGIKSRYFYANEDFKLQAKTAQELETKKTELEAQLAAIEGRWSKAEAASLQASNELKLNQNRINTTEDKIFKSFCEQVKIPNIRAYEETDVRDQEDFNRQKENFQHKLQQIQMKIDYETEQQRSLEDNIQRWKGTVADLKKELGKCEADEDWIGERMTDIDARLSSIQGAVKELKESIAEKGKEITFTNKTLTTADKGVLSLTKEIAHLQDSLFEAKMKRHDLFKQCKLTAVNLPFKSGSMDDIHVGGSELSAVSSNDSSAGGSGNVLRAFEVQDRLEMDYETLAREFKHRDNRATRQKAEEKLEGQLHELEVKITQIQAPNMNANQRWETINNKIREQQAEFEEMRQNVKRLREGFEKVKRERLDKFMKCFNKISQNIEGIYKTLTQHASAQAVLGLDNPEEPYLDGVSYHCVVPGKRFQPMSNLSGGEKTLAALALLFAIHSFEPAPFFVLDEIDAALDNTNIGKVISYIKSNTANLQVLVISLKEEFFEHADALLGVTPDVQESDCLCSRLYSLDLTEYDG